MTPKQWHRYLIDNISKILAKTVQDDQSCFIECGVKQGSSSVIMAKSLNRNGYLFDTWSGPPHFNKLDAPTEGKANRIRKRMNSGSTKKDCIKNLKQNNVRDMCSMIEGDICKTVPAFEAKNNICMMHIDTDVCEPAKVALEFFWPYMINGSVVFIHDYGDNKRWGGIQKVVDAFIKQYTAKDYFHVFDCNNLYAALIIKGNNEKIHSFIKDL